MGSSASKLHTVDSNAKLPSIEELKRGLLVPEVALISRHRSTAEYLPARMAMRNAQAR